MRRGQRAGRLTGAGPRLVFTGSLLALAFVAVIVSLTIGAREVAAFDVIRSWLDADVLVDPDDHYIVTSMRLPRTCVGVAVGAALGTAGALIQALTRNPLADTGILGVDAGAASAVTVGVALTGVAGIAGYGWFACAGALVVTVLVHIVGNSGRLGPDPTRLVLTGLALGAVISGFTGMLALSDPATFDAMRMWLVGSLQNRTFVHLVPMLPLIVVGMGLALGVAPALNALALGDDVAASQGVNITVLTSLVIVAITLLAGAATAICGPVGFVGLMVPHVVRWMVGPDQTWVLPLSALAGVSLVVLADVLGRVLVAPAEMPVGIVTAFVGAPVLIVLMRARGRVSEL